MRQTSAAALAAGDVQAREQAQRPNIVLIISDQFRWDCIGAAGLNPMNLTPHLDHMAREGTFFRNAFTNQPVCAPARATIFTGLYPSTHRVWKNGPRLPHDFPTLATLLRQAGYSANYIGKWHLAPNGDEPGATNGAVAPADRGGFLDLWEAANLLELTSHPYEGDIWDGDGRPIHFSGQYRADFLTERARRFLHSARPPFLLVLSYLEVHHQNDSDQFVPPREYAGRFKNPFVPQDLRPLPGSWPSQLADYFACVAKVDETVGAVRDLLREAGFEQNTLVAFTSDHGCHFKTRNTEYKRSPHESSIHIPLIVNGPGFNQGIEVEQLVSHIDLLPTLLEVAGAKAPDSLPGRSLVPLAKGLRQEGREEVFFEMSEFVTGRGLRTPQYTYAVAAPKTSGWKPVPRADAYQEYLAYDLYADPFQHVNLAGRAPYQGVLRELRDKLRNRMESVGEHAALGDCLFPYS
jgi:arylsulfatase A-like enzyme